MNESQLIASHRKAWKKEHPKDHYQKIQDGMGLGGKKPYDAYIMGTRDGLKEFWAKEFKIHKSHNAFPLSRIKPHQISGLMEAAQAGAIATVFIGVRFTMDVDTQARLNMRLRRISVDIELPVQDIVELIRAGKKSIPVLPYLIKEINRG